MTGEMEGRENLSDKTKDLERARKSIIEELDAINWYQERVENVKDAELRKILEHNRDEEKEHASMVLEWIRRRDPKFSAELQDYLFTDEPIAHE